MPSGIIPLPCVSLTAGEKGYEIYVRDAHENAEIIWNAVLEAGEEFGLMVIAPAHHRRIQAGILSWGQDLDHETSPFQVNLSYQVPRNKEADYIGKEELERQRAVIDEDNGFFLKKGGLEICRKGDDARWEELKRKVESGKAFGTNSALALDEETGRPFCLTVPAFLKRAD